MDARGAVFTTAKLIPSFRINRTDEGDYEGPEDHEAQRALKPFAFFAPFVVTLFVFEAFVR